MAVIKYHAIERDAQGKIIDEQWVPIYADAINNRLRKDSNLKDLQDVSAARKNLGLTGDVSDHNHDTRYSAWRQADQKTNADARAKIITDLSKEITEARALTNNKFEEAKKSFESLYSTAGKSITTEKKDRINEDSKLSARIDTEEQNRKNADNTINSKINTHESILNGTKDGKGLITKEGLVTKVAFNAAVISKHEDVLYHDTKDKEGNTVKGLIDRVADLEGKDIGVLITAIIKKAFEKRTGGIYTAINTAINTAIENAVSSIKTEITNIKNLNSSIDQSKLYQTIYDNATKANKLTDIVIDGYTKNNTRIPGLQDTVKDHEEALHGSTSTISRYGKGLVNIVCDTKNDKGEVTKGLASTVRDHTTTINNHTTTINNHTATINTHESILNDTKDKNGKVTKKGLVTKVSDLTSTVTNNTTAITNEVTNRNTAINTAITKEVTNRNTAINTAITKEVTNRNTAINTAKTALSKDITDAKNYILTSEPKSGKTWNGNIWIG